MDERAVRRPSVSVALVVVALMSCVHEIPPPVTVPVPPAASSEELRWVIEAALSAHNWKVLGRMPGSMGAYVRSQGSGDEATIEITYRPGGIEVRCVKANVSPQRYDRWIHLLSIEIQKNAALLGGRRPTAPSPPSSE
jgi:hypothetical protein